MTISNVIIHRDVRQVLGDLLSEDKFSKIAVLVDENTKKHCLDLVKSALPKNHYLIEIKSGEEEKHLDTCQYIWQQLTDKAFDRKSLLINLGGGVIGDMGGFCAATFKRGISFINIPTTLLAQVDASVGGKLGIDFQGFKNHIGVFQEPYKVLISPVFLDTLEERELRSGFAEVIKHCLIKDKEKFGEIAQKNLDDQDWDDVISHSVKVKREVIEEDPQERGLRKILNFGHTLGHAIETYYLNKGERILHGEAIAIGMISEAWLSELKCGMKPKETEEIFNYISQIYDLKAIEKEAFDEIIHLTSQDKKNENDIVKASLLKNVGYCLFNMEINKDEMLDALEYYNSKIKN